MIGILTFHFENMCSDVMIHFLFLSSSRYIFISFAVRWNNRVEKLKVAEGEGRLTSCVDPQQIQRLNQNAGYFLDNEKNLSTLPLLMHDIVCF